MRETPAEGPSSRWAARVSERVLLRVLALLIVAYGLTLAFAKFPIEMWDESRQAVNALEMNRTGFSLVTTYGFRPDLWNTKPPLLVWAIVACFRLFGVSLFALRLPSTLASVGTLALVAAFCWRTTRRASVALLATVLLMASPLFFGPHIGLTADFDALLVLFLTTVGLAFYEAANAPAGESSRFWLVAGVALGLAILTKGIAGALILPGLFVYLLAIRGWPRALRTPAFWAAILIAAGLAAGFYLLREHVASGYIPAVLRNEVSGRYGTSIEGHKGPPWYYLAFLSQGFSLGPLFLLAPFLVRGAPETIRGVARFAALVGFTMLVIYSSASTKIPWYVAPTIPFFAILSALAIDHVVRRLDAPRLTDRLARGAILVVLLLAFVRMTGLLAVYSRHVPFLRADDRGRYGALFDGLQRLGAPHVTVVDSHYAPLYRYYSMTQDTPAHSTDLVTSVEGIPSDGRLVATCDPEVLPKLLRAGQPIESCPDYAIVRLTR